MAVIYPLEFHRRSERQWRHRVKASTRSGDDKASTIRGNECCPNCCLPAAKPFVSSRPLQPIRKDLVIRFRRQRLAREAIMAAKEISVKKYVVRLSGEERER